MPEKIAILCSDIHLSHSPPVARSGEADWYEAMARPLRELKNLAEGLPVLIGGDLFDKWRSCPCLINFAMRELPVYPLSVMGQHDLPYHSWKERESSAFWTLIEGGRMELLDQWNETGHRLLIRGYSWGEELVPNAITTNALKVAVAHKYCWAGGCMEPAIATEENRLNSASCPYSDQLEGCNVALFGDNHKGFLTKQKGITIFNAGTFMRRRADEADYSPMVGILHEDGSVKKQFLDTSAEVLDASTDAVAAEGVLIRMESFLDELQSLGEGALDFRKVVEVTMKRQSVKKAVVRIVLEAMEERDGD